MRTRALRIASAIVGLGAIVLAWRGELGEVINLLIPQGIRSHLGVGRELRVYSHHGEWIMKPCLVIPGSPGDPPAFKVSGELLIEIPADLATNGREMLVTGPGCGLFRGEFRHQGRLTLPPPVSATIHVPGEFPLPCGKHGIRLRLRAVGVAPEVAWVMRCGPVDARHWEQPESLTWNEEIWLDPATRSVSVLLPCLGKWRVEWSHLRRLGTPELGGPSILYGTGEGVVSLEVDGETLTLVVDPVALSPR